MTDQLVYILMSSDPTRGSRRLRWGGAKLTLLPQRLKAPPVSKFDSEHDKSAFNLNLVFLSLRQYVEGRSDDAQSLARDAAGAEVQA